MPMAHLDDPTVSEKNTFRLLILGSAGVGKSAIIKRFLDNQFDERYIPTIEEFHRKLYRIKGESYLLEILDIGGLNPFPASRRITIMAGDLFILACSFDKPESLEEVKNLRQQVLDTLRSSNKLTAGVKNVPLIITCNKSDLAESARSVSVSELKELAQNLKNCSVVETSAKNDVNIDEMFVQLFMNSHLPIEMTPSYHRRVTMTYLSAIDNRSQAEMWSMVSRLSFKRRFSNVAVVNMNLQRPSIASDLNRIERKELHRQHANGLLTSFRDRSKHTDRTHSARRRCTLL